MNTITIPNRPFASDIITGLMLPDGIFVTMLGNQNVNAHFSNTGASTTEYCQVYVESASNPGIVLAPKTNYLGPLEGGASRVLSWDADFSACPAGTHYISFIVEDSSGKSRLIKKIFVLRVAFDASKVAFYAETPEGVLMAQFSDLIKPRRMCCRPRRRDDKRLTERYMSYTINNFAKLFKGHDPFFKLCPPGYLPDRIHSVWTPTPPYTGQYSELPFQDPWWKVLLCIIAILLAIASAIVEATSGSGEVTVTTGGGTGGGGGDVCDCEVEGGGTSYVAAGLLAAAAAVATAAAASDKRDPFRRGQDNTVPEAGELTTEEILDAEFDYPEPIEFGKPFAVGLRWKYRRVTTGNDYDYGANDVTQNIHIISGYKIDAPEYYYRHNKDYQWIIKAVFTDKDNNLFHGSDLFVQCFLISPTGYWHKIILQDDGTWPDEKPTDGVYTSYFTFPGNDAKGLWTYYVIAQDINHAQPEMKPEEAAQIIGGMVLTNQLTITFDEDECPFVPDGHVQVI